MNLPAEIGTLIQDFLRPNDWYQYNWYVAREKWIAKQEHFEFKLGQRFCESPQPKPKNVYTIVGFTATQAKVQCPDGSIINRKITRNKALMKYYQEGKHPVLPEPEIKIDKKLTLKLKLIV